MKINFDGRRELKDIYQVGNVIKDNTNTLYLIVGNVEDGYAMVNLTNNNVTEKVSTLEELADIYGEDEDVLVNAKLIVDYKLDGDTLNEDSK